MISFLFWNTYKKDNSEIIRNIAQNYDIDILIFVEFSQPIDKTLHFLNGNNNRNYKYLQKIGCEKIEIFSRFPERFFKIISETDNLTIRHFQFPNKIDIIIAITHFYSKLFMKPNDQVFLCTDTIQQITEAEKMIGHSRTIFVGDLNMNPFEDGVISSRGFHGTMCRSLAEEKFRISSNKRCEYFYNPMWNFLGDRGPFPPGTYFYRDGSPTNLFWNMFDQVLIRPDLLRYFNNDDIGIVVSDGNGFSLLDSKGYPNKKEISDHLPIYFRLSI